METNTPEGKEKIRAPLTKRYTTGSSESHTLPSIQRGRQLPNQSPAHTSSPPRTTPRRLNKPYTTSPSSASNVEGDFPTREGTSQPPTTPNLQPSGHHPFRTGLNRAKMELSPLPNRQHTPTAAPHLPFNHSTPPHPPHMAHPTSPPTSRPSSHGSTVFHCAPLPTPDTPRTKPNPPRGIERETLSQRYDAALYSTRSRRI